MFHVTKTKDGRLKNEEAKIIDDNEKVIKYLENEKCHFACDCKEIKRIMRTLKCKLYYIIYNEVPVISEDVFEEERPKSDIINRSNSFDIPDAYEDFFDIDRTLTEDGN